MTRQTYDRASRLTKLTTAHISNGAFEKMIRSSAHDIELKVMYPMTLDHNYFEIYHAGHFEKCSTISYWTQYTVEDEKYLYSPCYVLMQTLDCCRQL